jgi:hypothetical protein
MGTTYGRQILETTGASVQVAADARPLMKPGGITIDWSTIAAAGADVSLEDGFFCPSGEKYLRYGQILTRIVVAAEVQTLTVTGTPTGGSLVVSGINPNSQSAIQGTIVYNSTAAQAQVIADAIFGVGNVVVGGGALPGAALTFTFRGDWDPAQMTVVTNGLTGGSTPAGAFTTTTPANTSAGLWGPYDPGASDGRQTLTKGDCFILNESIRETGDPHSNHPPALQGGLIWKARILQSGAATHTLALGPTLAEFEAAFPMIRYAKM